MAKLLTAAMDAARQEVADQAKGMMTLQAQVTAAEAEREKHLSDFYQLRTAFSELQAAHTKLEYQHFASVAGAEDLSETVRLPRPDQ